MTEVSSVASHPHHTPQTYLLQYFPDDLRGFAVRPQQLLALLPLLSHAFILVQQLLEQVFAVQLTDQPVLNGVLGEFDE